MKKTKLTVDEFRRQTRMDGFQKELLEEIWLRFRKEGKWPVLRELYSKHGRDRVRKALSALKGNVGHEESGSSHWRTYQLSLLGALLTKEGASFQLLLLRFFEFQRDLYHNEPLKSFFKADEIGGALKLSQEQIILMGQLLSLCYLGGSNTPSNSWGTNAMDEAETFPDGDLSTELDKVVFRNYQPNAVAFEDERQRSVQPFMAPSGFPLESLVPWQSEIPARVQTTYWRNTAFIMMWMDRSRPELDDVSNAIKDVCSEYGIKAIRADDVEHQDRITDVVLENIRESEFLIADLSGERPNVYYEIGYAHAIDKRPILYRKGGTPLHFDLSVHNVPDYRNVSHLKEQLRHRFETLLGRKPKAQKGGVVRQSRSVATVH
jgi:hypothetical protein